MDLGGKGWLRAAGVLVGVWAVLLGLVVGAGWLITHTGRAEVNGFDDPISRWFADSRDPTLGHVADVGTYLGETVVGVTLVVLTGLGFALWRRTWRPLVFVVLVEAGIGGFYAIATAADPRQRPPVRILDPGLVPDASFPSGHTATATALALCVLLLTRAYAARAVRWVTPVLLVPVFTAVARLYQGAHHLTDVLTSMAYASVWVITVAAVVLPAAERRVSPRPRAQEGDRDAATVTP